MANQNDIEKFRAEWRREIAQSSAVHKRRTWEMAGDVNTRSAGKSSALSAMLNDFARAQKHDDMIDESDEAEEEEEKEERGRAGSKNASSNTELKGRPTKQLRLVDLFIADVVSTTI